MAVLKECPSMNLESKQAFFKRYTPLDNARIPEWGPGNNLRDLLSSFEASVWSAALQYQDKREDLGQGEVVTYFAHHLSVLANLDNTDREVVVLAAILHDTGYARMPLVNERFRAAIERERPDVPVTRSFRDLAELAFYQFECLFDIRVQHQNHSVQIAREILHTYPDERLERVVEIVSDHDTRAYPPSRLAKLMWDADVLWRLSVPFRKSWAPKSDAGRFFEMMHGQIVAPNNILTPEATAVSRIELANTMVFLFAETEWPAQFITEYNLELQLLSRNYA